MPSPHSFSALCGYREGSSCPCNTLRMFAWLGHSVSVNLRHEGASQDRQGLLGSMERYEQQDFLCGTDHQGQREE